jgi:hypothetical protein
MNSDTVLRVAKHLGQHVANYGQFHFGLAVEDHVQQYGEMPSVVREQFFAICPLAEPSQILEQISTKNPAYLFDLYSQWENQRGNPFIGSRNLFLAELTRFHVPIIARWLHHRKTHTATDIASCFQLADADIVRSAWVVHEYLGPIGEIISRGMADRRSD